MWRKCIFNSDIEISDDGKVRRRISNITEANGDAAPDAYKELQMYKYGKYMCVNFNNKTYPVHRLVAIHFIENPNNYELVIFKDRDFSNITSTNLEWVTRSDKMKTILADSNYKSSCGRSKKVYCEETQRNFHNMKQLHEYLHSVNDSANYDTLARKFRKSSEVEYLGFHLKLINE